MKLRELVSIVMAVTLVFVAFFLLFILTNEGLPTMESQVITARSGVTLILDPGHGGADGGAVSITGSLESAINLKIALKAENIAAFYGITPVMTRRSENIEYPKGADTIRAKKVADQKSRVAQINSTADGVLISIHQNTYISPEPSGAQVFYSATAGSKEFAEYTQQLLSSNLDSGNRVSANQISASIYLMNSVECPAILVECGFLSNEREAALLENETYQTKLAAIIVGSFIGYYNTII